MSFSKTFSSLLRPGTAEQEVERKDEFMEKNTNLLSEESIFNPDQTYQPSTYKFLDSEVFTLSTNSVYFAEPRDYEDAEIITEAIEAGKIVIMRLDNLEEGLDKRILDFVTGFCCAFKIIPLKTSIETQWIIDPKNKRTKNMR